MPTLSPLRHLTAAPTLLIVEIFLGTNLKLVDSSVIKFLNRGNTEKSD